MTSYSLTHPKSTSWRPQPVVLLLTLSLVLSAVASAQAQWNYSSPALARVQQAVRQKMLSDVPGQAADVTFTSQPDVRTSATETTVRGSGTFRSYYNAPVTWFTYEGTTDNRTGQVYNVRYSLRERGQGYDPRGQGGYEDRNTAIREVQEAIAERLRRERRGGQVSFHNDAQVTEASRREIRVQGTGMQGRQGRERVFRYSGTYNTRSRQVRQAEYEFSGRWNDDRHDGHDGRTEPDRVVDSNHVNQTYTCDNNAFVLNGDHCNLVIRGTAREVRINGSHNKIRIEAATAAVVVPGEDNLIRWSVRRNPTPPQILNSGRANDIGGE